MATHGTIYELAKNVDRAQAELERAKQALLAAISDGSRRGFPVPKNGAGPRRGPGSNSIAQQVLQLLAANPGGLPRAEILRRIPGNEGAVQSALKKHRENKRITNEDGLWKHLGGGAPAGRKGKKKGPQP